MQVAEGRRASSLKFLECKLCVSEEWINRRLVSAVKSKLKTTRMPVFLSVGNRKLHMKSAGNGLLSMKTELCYTWHVCLHVCVIVLIVL